MDPEFWHERWRSGQIGFHRSSVHPDLLSFAPEWIAGGRGVLVPLCGKSLDLPWLAGHMPTVGVELSELAIRQLHEEQALSPTITEDGPFRTWRTQNLSVHQGDLYDLGPAELAGVDRVWDRASYVALDPDRRRRYVAHLRGLLPAGTRWLLNVVRYDSSRQGGPPHSITEEEVREVFAGAEVSLLLRADELDDRARANGHTWWEKSVYGVVL